jgi:hypothetical protein
MNANSHYAAKILVEFYEYRNKPPIEEKQRKVQ